MTIIAAPLYTFGETAVIASAPIADTVSLIGMPGAGKSTVGVILAKLTGLRFVDTDLDIQIREQATLQQILERDGHQRLRAIEQEVLLDICLQHSIIATGGSVVYSHPVMQRLRAAGPVVYLRADLSTLQKRISAAGPRGIACAPSQAFRDVYDERTPLYERYADVTVESGTGSADDVAQGILRQLAG